MVAMAVVFVVGLFLFKNKSSFKNENTLTAGGLVHGNELIGDLVSKDTDLDGVLDWEESLWGTDPTKKDTNDDGVLDDIEVERLKAARGEHELDIGEGKEGPNEELTQTDKFARELFTTIATLNQAGEIDQSTIDKLSETLAEQIQNSAPRKVYTLAELKIIKNDTRQSIKNYKETLDKIYKKYPYPKDTVLDVLEKFITDGENVNENILSELDPIIQQSNKIIDEIVKMEIPSSLALLHLDVLNGLQKSSESMGNIRLYGTDVIVALGGINQYPTNITDLEIAVNKLVNELEKRLK